MKNYWAIGSDRFFSNECEKELYSIQLFEDEQTHEVFRPSNIICEFKLPAGYLMPSGYFDQADIHGNLTIIRIDQLMIFDPFGNLRGEMLISTSSTCFVTRNLQLKTSGCKFVNQ